MSHKPTAGSTTLRSTAARAVCTPTTFQQLHTGFRVSKEIERNIGNLFLYDKVLQKAICPEKRAGLDSALSAIASVTEVRLSSDLQVAKVYISIFSDDRGKETAMRQLSKLQGYARKHIGKEMSLRLTPEIRFVFDDSIERSERVDKLLQRIKLQASGEAEAPPIALPDWLDEEELDGDDEDVTVEASATDGEDAAEDQDEENEDEDDEKLEGFFDDDDDQASSAPQASSAAGDDRWSSPRSAGDDSFFGFEDPGGALEESATPSASEDDDLLEGEVPDGLPLVLTNAEPLEQLAVSERSSGQKRRPAAKRRTGPSRRR